MEVFEAKLLVRQECDLGEGIQWNPSSQHIYWVDINRGHLFRCNANGERVERKELGLMVGAVTPTTAPDIFLLATENGFQLYNWESGVLQMVEDPEHHLPLNRFNDGKCDPEGRFWAGTMARNAKGTAGSLYCLDPATLKPTMKLKDIGISNGLAWDVNKKKFYYVDTSTDAVTSFDYTDDGWIFHSRCAFKIPPASGSPDGMTIDNDGMLWIAHWDGYQVSRWDPDSGEQLATIAIPAPRVTCCSFGGQDLQTLFISSAREGMNADQLNQHPLSGSVFSIRLPYTGLPLVPFKMNAEA